MRDSPIGFCMNDTKALTQCSLAGNSHSLSRNYWHHNPGQRHRQAQEDRGMDLHPSSKEQRTQGSGCQSGHSQNCLGLQPGTLLRPPLDQSCLGTRWFCCCPSCPSAHLVRVHVCALHVHVSPEGWRQKPGISPAASNSRCSVMRKARAFEIIMIINLKCVYFTSLIVSLIKFG